MAIPVPQVSYFVEYGNVFDVMGRGGVRGPFNAWFKSRMDWLTPADYTSVTANATMMPPTQIGPDSAFSTTPSR